MKRWISKARTARPLALSLAAMTLVAFAGPAERHQAPSAAGVVGQLLSVTGVTASGDDGTNRAGQAVDGNLGTRWSGPGDGAWIRLTLGSSATVQSLQIAWYHGNERISFFDVQTSADAATWTTVFTGQSAGSTTSYETYDVADSVARYVRIVGHGNSVNDWTSITEIRVYGVGSGGGQDPNGVNRLYQSASTGAAPWYLGFNNDGSPGTGYLNRTLNSKFEDVSIISGDRVGADTVVTTDDTRQVRLTVYAEAGKDCYDSTRYGDAAAGISAWDQGVMWTRGYQCTPLDWENVEVTGYFRYAGGYDANSSELWQIYSNGGRHPGSDPGNCTASAYKARYDFRNHDIEVVKESFHDGGYDTADENSREYPISFGQTTWVGMKYVRYELSPSQSPDGERAVRIEVYIDRGGLRSDGTPANDWQLVRAVNDLGDHWGGVRTNGDNAETLCNAPDPYTEMLWGGPWVAWRWDYVSTDIRLMSIREIVPGQRA